MAVLLQFNYRTDRIKLQVNNGESNRKAHRRCVSNVLLLFLFNYSFSELLKQCFVSYIYGVKIKTKAKERRNPHMLAQRR